MGKGNGKLNFKSREGKVMGKGELHEEFVKGKKRGGTGKHGQIWDEFRVKRSEK